jgi:hypothetical protein
MIKYIVVIVLMPFVAFALGDEGVTIGIKVVSEHVVFYEPIYLVYSVTNNTPQPAVVTYIPQIKVSSASGEEVKTRNGDIEIIFGPGNPKKMDAGKSSECIIDLFETYNINKPGTYEVVVTNKDGNNQIASTRKTIIIDNPEGVNLAPSKILREGIAENGTPAIFKAAPLIALFYQDSAYYKYCYFWMGEMVEPKVAIKCYEKALELFPDYPRKEYIEHKILLNKRAARLISVDEYIASLVEMKNKAKDMVLIIHIEDELRDFSKLHVIPGGNDGSDKP